MKDFKYYILTLIGLLCPLMTMAEETDLGVPKVWTVPAVFTCDEEVTFYYDMTDVKFPAGVDLYCGHGRRQNLMLATAITLLRLLNWNTWETISIVRR